ncbi:unnamed protein product [Clonostachys chloroleuca]|uniref:Uncharacterized protein n=1 Tax=Clonostachys chloroleuca TaxID=1926264 RepID=A0AA35Q9S5_9HYPO|nr:unnamed protein product [Clonostachys chloroleuca]
MPPSKGSSLWDNPEFLSNVIIGLYEAGTISKGLSPKMREGIVQYLNNCESPAHNSPASISFLNNSFLVPSLLHSLHSFAPFNIFNTFIHSFVTTPTLPDMPSLGRSMQRWDAHTHEDILLALFQHVKIPTSDIQKVMGELRAKGYTFTENALRYNSLFGFCCFCLLASHFSPLHLHPPHLLFISSPETPNSSSFHPLRNLSCAYLLVVQHLTPTPIQIQSSRVYQILPPFKMSNTPSKKARGWDENSHLDLLLCFIYETKATKAVITNITERMKLMGHTYSFDAIKYSLAQHVQKLRKQKDISSIQNAGGIETPTKGTPSKATPRKGASAKKAAGKGSRKRFASDDSEIDDDDFKKEEGLSDIERSPSKKPVKRVKKEPSAVLFGCPKWYTGYDCKIFGIGWLRYNE